MLLRCLGRRTAVLCLREIAARRSYRLSVFAGNDVRAEHKTIEKSFESSLLKSFKSSLLESFKSSLLESIESSLLGPFESSLLESFQNAERGAFHATFQETFAFTDSWAEQGPIHHTDHPRADRPAVRGSVESSISKSFRNAERDSHQYAYKSSIWRANNSKSNLLASDDEAHE